MIKTRKKREALQHFTRYATTKKARGFALREVVASYSKSTNLLNSIIHGDARSELRQFPTDYIDLIVTSPPYADSRKQTYGGIHPDDYVEWFLPFAEELLRVLKLTGSFVLNIKEKVIAFTSAKREGPRGYNK